MRSSGWTMILLACILTPFDRDGLAQSAPDSTRSTLSGVYTAQQAARGRDLYAGTCQGCHTAASHTGPVFATWWGGRRLSDLFSYVSEQMPKDNPGILSPQEYAQVVAYLLSLNEMPAGQVELPADPRVLMQIRIDPASGQSPPDP